MGFKRGAASAHPLARPSKCAKQDACMHSQTDTTRWAPDLHCQTPGTCTHLCARVQNVIAACGGSAEAADLWLREMSDLPDASPNVGPNSRSVSEIDGLGLQAASGVQRRSVSLSPASEHSRTQATTSQTSGCAKRSSPASVQQGGSARAHSAGGTRHSAGKSQQRRGMHTLLQMYADAPTAPALHQHNPGMHYRNRMRT